MKFSIEVSHDNKAVRDIYVSKMLLDIQSKAKVEALKQDDGLKSRGVTASFIFELIGGISSAVYIADTIFSYVKSKNLKVVVLNIDNGKKFLLKGDESISDLEDFLNS